MTDRKNKCQRLDWNIFENDSKETHSIYQSILQKFCNLTILRNLNQVSKFVVSFSFRHFAVLTRKLKLDKIISFSIPIYPFSLVNHFLVWEKRNEKKKEENFIERLSLNTEQRACSKWLAENTKLWQIHPVRKSKRKAQAFFLPHYFFGLSKGSELM